jgi:hypothetical protein
MTATDTIVLSSIKMFQLEWFKSPNGYGREIAETYAWKENNKPKITRRYIDSYQAFEAYLKQDPTIHFSGRYMSVHSFSSLNHPQVIDKLYFDFDSAANIEAAYIEASDFQRKLKTYYSADSLLVFSGKKGYAVYVWLTKPITAATEQNLKAVYNRLQETLLLGTSYTTLDHSVIGDIKRVSRVPYTLHQDRGSLCCPVNDKGEAILITSIDNYRTHGLSTQFIEFCIKKEEAEQKKRVEAEQKHKQYIHSHPRRAVYKRGIRPCIEALLHQTLTGTKGHDGRLIAATEYLNNGFSAEETAALFSGQPDYNAAQSLEYVQKLTAYKPYRCCTIAKKGFCLPDCPRRHRMEASA